MWSSTFLDKSRNRTLALLLAGEERLQLFNHDLIQNGFFGLPRNVFERPRRHGEA